MKTIKKEIKEFKFEKNIKTIIKNKLSEIQAALDVEKCTYYISGGFALALLIAPRTRQPNLSNPFENNPNLDLSKEYYDDIDLFFPTELDFYKAKSVLERYCSNLFLFENENQCTYHTKTGEKIQLIKKEFGTPSELMKNFDVINCCIFLTKELDIITHHNFYRSILTKELVLNKMKFTEIEEDEEFKKYTAIIVKRVLKYTQRYNWTLSQNLKSYLQAVINYYPDVIFKENKFFYGNSSSYTVQSNINVWESIRHLGLEIPNKQQQCQQDT